ncbi:sigma-E factor negative regulatory protein [Acidovorax sp. DW039]|uniref:sigma-E factor negative regulatory protein n=1 Tax=Acidovorax sp. DW039 TaxID=3095606 RepID=UPI003087AE62|nr:sigma-E factor negative regulatory protein [Acidovorax sp. DW039]
MNRNVNQGEQLSALMDGELEGDAFAQALLFAQDDEVLATWELYHVVGDVLRSPELAQHAAAPNPLIAKLREQMAQEPVFPHQQAPAMSLDAVAVPDLPAANASVFRWKMVAGVASLAAVAAIAWNSFSALKTEGPQLAAAPASNSSVVAVSEGSGQPVMLRDPRLDELLQAHKQFGSTSALQMPAGFLRNATFEEPSR